MARSKVTIDEKNDNELEIKKITARKSSKSDKTTNSKKNTVSTKTPTEKKAGTSTKSGSSRKTTVTVKSTTAKKSRTSAKSTATKKSGTSAKSTTAKKSGTSAKSVATKRDKKKIDNKLSLKNLISKRIFSGKKSKSDEENEKFVDIPEYYDLPYKYEKTVVKELYQNPTTLFVYWDISDDDINGFKKAYGDNFFYVTKPVLVIHNITDGYSFEVEVNDFANNWYIHVSDAKCKYNVELGRRPSQSAKIENIAEHRMDDFINVSYSNTVEMPNDHILYFKNNDKIYFKNIKTNKVTEKVINSKKDAKNIKSIYNKYNLTDKDDRFDLNNPSSQNPTSNIM